MAAANELRICGERIDFGRLLRFSLIDVGGIEHSAVFTLKMDARDHRRECLLGLTSEVLGLGGGDGGSAGTGSGPDLDEGRKAEEELERST
jgi:hypothetical protein